MIVPIIIPTNIGGGDPSIKQLIAIYIVFNIIGLIVIIVRTLQYFYKKYKIKKRQYQEPGYFTSADNFSFFDYVLFDYDLEFMASFINGLTLLIVNIGAACILIFMWLMTIVQKFL
jgi:hypothetical protein